MSMWLRWHLTDYREIVFTGSRSALSYVVGYGLFAGSWAGEFFDPRSTEFAQPNQKLFYVVNQWQLTLPYAGRTYLTPSNLEYLDAKFDLIYDDGTMSIYCKL